MGVASTSRRRLEVENLFLRHQLNIALRRTPHRLCSVCPTSFSLPRSCGGIEQGFGPIGAGSLAVDQEGPKLTVSCASSSNG